MACSVVERERPKTAKMSDYMARGVLGISTVVGEDECKQAAVKYLKEVSTEKLWKSSPVWSDATRPSPNSSATSSAYTQLHQRTGPT